MHAHFYVETVGTFRRRFELLDGRLIIQRTMGKPQTIELARVALPSRETVAVNRMALLRSSIYLIISVCVVVAAGVILSLSLALIVILALVFAAPALHVIWTYKRPLRIEKYYYRSGELAFDIVLTDSEDSERKIFVEALRVEMQRIPVA